MHTDKQDSTSPTNQVRPSPGSAPVPQRALRAHRPARASDRRAASGAHLADIAHRLTPRDVWLARMLHEHRVLTSAQLGDLAFDAIRRANRRLRELYRWRVVDRFQPHRLSGTAPMHYVLDIAGAAALRDRLGITSQQLGYRHDRALGIAHSLRLAHTVGVNGVFTDFVAYARTHPGCALDPWWSETHCARLYGDLVRPDGYGRWYEDDCQVEFFLEYDTGTEPLARVVAKLDDYHRLAAATGITTPVLFCFPTTDREANVRDALAAALRMLERPCAVPVATAHHTGRDTAAPEGAPAMADARWAPLDTCRAQKRRQRLVALADIWPHVQLPQSRPPAAAGSVPGEVDEHRTEQHELGPPSPMPPDRTAPSLPAACPS